MENTNDRQLTFPQRNWLLLCILVAILSPLVVHWLQAGAHKEAYRESIETKPVNSDGGGGAGAAGGAAPGAGAAPAGGASANPGDSAAGKGKDTSYKVATPPTDSGKKSGAAPAGGAGKGGGAGGSKKQ